MLIAAYYIVGGDLVWALVSGLRSSREKNVRGLEIVLLRVGYRYACWGSVGGGGEEGGDMIQKSKVMHYSFQ